MQGKKTKVKFLHEVNITDAKALAHLATIYSANNSGRQNVQKCFCKSDY